MKALILFLMLVVGAFAQDGLRLDTRKYIYTCLSDGGKITATAESDIDVFLQQADSRGLLSRWNEVYLVRSGYNSNSQSIVRGLRLLNTGTFSSLPAVWTEGGIDFSRGYFIQTQTAIGQPDHIICAGYSTTGGANFTDSQDSNNRQVFYYDGGGLAVYTSFGFSGTSNLLSDGEQFWAMANFSAGNATLVKNAGTFETVTVAADANGFGRFGGFQGNGAGGGMVTGKMQLYIVGSGTLTPDENAFLYNLSKRTILRGVGLP
jgi:hypothetical protein